MAEPVDGLSKKERFRNLAEAVQACTICPEMVGRARILSRGNGDLEAKILFVAEAPGRLGADRTGLPLFGDRTGENFQALLEHVG